MIKFDGSAFDLFGQESFEYVNVDVSLLGCLDHIDLGFVAQFDCFSYGHLGSKGR